MHVNNHYCAIVFTIQRGDACACSLSFSSTEATAMVILLSIIAQTYKHVAENSTVSNAQLTPTHPHEPFGSRVSAENLRWFFFLPREIVSSHNAGDTTSRKGIAAERVCSHSKDCCRSEIIDYHPSSVQKSRTERYTRA